MDDDTTTEPADAELRRLERRSERFETPCGDGVMVWHAWGSGPPLVMLHGGNGSWRHWVRAIPHFARTHRVVAPDLPGLGESARAPEPPTQDSIAQIVGDGLDRIIGAQARYDLVGFSFGGMISGHLAVLHGERVRSLTVNGPGGLGTKKRTFELVSVRDKTGQERLDGHRTNLERLMLHDPGKVDDLAMAMQEWHSVRNRLRTPTLSRSTSLAGAIARVSAPVNAIYGEFDAPANPNIEERREMLTAIRPDIDFRVIAGVGHWTSYEAPEAFNAMLTEMLGAADARR